MTTTGEQALSGRVAMVTGASRRIGRATALGLARHGADVIVTARSARDEIEAVAEEIRALGRRAQVVMGDVTSESDVIRMGEEARSAFGRIDILVNNAAVRRQSPLLDMSLSEWREINSVVLDGAFLVSRSILPVMIENSYGVIVNIGGVTGHIGAKNRAHVCTAKAGLVGLTKAIAVEFADRGITANCLVPGKIGGERSATSGESPAMPADILLGREGEIDEAAGMVVALCLPAARFMTGQTVHVSGGLYMP
ncbi:SDR family oxidoreductase [Halovulum dunhuangense]|uniref:SDR family oxidoreductase n=1 Tax=Halovulum dunhuangense TaxID=1505036 RepID=A0A849L1J6_9RHOB|nr:SDR family oxidoreductase [Halovulum dunhuangense]NNU80178.1 SDR family oxidoreductase [Halovulum dunhuangense]